MIRNIVGKNQHTCITNIKRLTTLYITQCMIPKVDLWNIEHLYSNEIQRTDIGYNIGKNSIYR